MDPASRDRQPPPAVRPADFLNFAECFTEAMLMLSFDGRVLAANRAALILLRVPAGTRVCGRALADFIDNRAENLQAFLETCADSEGPVTGTLHFRSQAENNHTICQGRALVDSDPAVILLRCLPDGELSSIDQALTASHARLRHEIERRRRIEQQPRSEAAHAQAVLDTAADAIITIDSQGLVQSFNPAAERLFGYTASEVMGRNVKLLMPAPYRDKHDDYMAHYLRTGEKRIIGIGREVQGLRKDGTVFPLELAVSEVRIGELHHFTGFIRDISERKQAEQRLRQREEEARLHRERLVHVSRLSTMGELAAGIAHEINQPLAAITTYSNACERLLRQGEMTADELLETLARIGNQACRAGLVIQRLRTMVRRRDSRRERCDLNQLIRETLVLAETDARLNDFRIATALTTEALWVEVDPIQIQQVLLNLIRNGMDAMVEAGTERGLIQVQTRLLVDSESAEVRVSDQGNGLPAELHDELFSPFFTTKPEGIGLGLSISRSIITKHGGRLNCETDTDRGLSMIVVLPLGLESVHDEN